ncbi:MAG TPA: hypothetical protein VLD37_02570 [Candidatus Bilamarchaeum sp.]|nr:hypothetical protein [Candidatus Bilamarchaeum sp.]
MRPLILVLIPVVLFAGALLTAGDSKPEERAPPVYPSMAVEALPPAPEPAQANPPAQQESAPAAPALPVSEPSPAPVLVPAKECTNSAGTEAYETDEGLQVAIESERAQCDSPVAILKDGKEYFGCLGGRIILDCDWFVETPGAETATENAVFGDSYVVDFFVPDTSGLSCSDEMVPAEALAHVGGNVCDLQRLIGNLNQMHGG